MPGNKLHTYFRKFVIALILLFTFLMPLKLGGIIGIPETASFFPKEIGAYFFITWPPFIFPFVSGILLLLSLAAFPFSSLSFSKDKLLICASLWVLMAFTALLGIINASVWDFVIMQITHLFGLAAYALTVYLFLKNAPRAKMMLTASILAGLAITVYLGFEQYFTGFDEMRDYLAKQEKIAGSQADGVIKAKVLDRRLSTPFTSCNSLAGYLILTTPLCLVILWKLCAKVEPPKTARLIFIPLAAAALIFVLAATRARSAFLALILTTGVFILLFPVKKWLRWTIIILAPLIVIGGAVYIYKFGRGFQSMQVRIDYFIVSIKLLLKHPFIGVGWGDFFYDYMKLKTIYAREAPHAPHNLFTAMGGQAGILALLVSIGALFYPFRPGIKKVKKLIAEHSYMEEDVALIFGFTAFLFHAMMDIDLQVPALMGTAIAVSLLMAMPGPEDEKLCGQDKAKTTCRIIACLTALVIAATAIAGGRHLLSSEYLFAQLEDTCKLQGKTRQEIANISAYEVNEKLEAVTEARPYSPFPYSKAGEFYMATSRFKPAESCYEKALKLAPKSGAYHFRLFYLLDIQGGRREEAIKHLRQANELFPNHPKYKEAQDALIKP
ncbi:MAG: O-antigen ligase family protein [Victivallaceae bacterium]|nr:O-antigen ligase family protein [Victivallaceae bacterium]